MRTSDKLNNSDCSNESTQSESNCCPEKQYRMLMMTQMHIYRNHIGAHLKLHPHVCSKEKSLAHFFNMFGKFFRNIFCGFACEKRTDCLVLKLSFANIQETYDFEHLESFKQDFSLGVMVENCHHSNELNAIQIHIAYNFIKFNSETKKYYICEISETTKEKVLKKFLKKYGHLLQEMFCSAVCINRSNCKRGNVYIPRQYA